MTDDVTQADRDAAAEYGRAVGILTRTECRAMRSGENDDCTLTQAFARHRQATVDKIVAMIAREFDAPHVTGVAGRIAAAIQRGEWKQ